MSAIGDYVHYYWSNYQKYGTTVKEKSGKPIEPAFLTRLADHRKQQLLHLGPSEAEIKHLTRQYNEDRLQKFKALIEFFNDNEHGTERMRHFFDLLVKNASSIGKDITGDDLMPFFTFDPSTQLIKTRLPESIKGLANLKKGKAYGTQAANIAALREVLKSVVEQRDVISKILNDQKKPLSPSLKQTYTTILHEIDNELNKDYSNLDMFIKTNKKNPPVRTLKQLYDNVFTGRVPVEIAQSFYRKMNSIFNVTRLVGIEAALNSSLPEVLGTNIKEFITLYTEGKVAEAFQEIFSRLKGNLPSKSNIPLQTIDLDNKVVNSWIAKNYISKQDLNGAKIQFNYNFPKGKVDTVIQIDTKDYNVSAKAYKLNIDNYRGRPASISLHSGTSFLGLLVGFEDTNIVNHLLNIYASHPSKDDNLSGYMALKAAAVNCLMVSLLYSGLTGAGLGRVGNDLVDLLLIEDTSRTVAQRDGQKLYYNYFISYNQLVNRVHSYDFLVNDQPGSTFFENFKLINFSAETPQARISKLLLHAKSQKLHLALTHSAIKTITNNSNVFYIE